jgi:hypothetical protein
MLAFLLVSTAIGVVALAPDSPVVLSVTATHGIHAADLPVLALLLAATWLVLR